MALSLNITHNSFDDIRNFCRNFLFLSLIISWTWCTFSWLLNDRLISRWKIFLKQLWTEWCCLRSRLRTTHNITQILRHWSYAASTASEVPMRRRISFSRPQSLCGNVVCHPLCASAYHWTCCGVWAAIGRNLVKRMSETDKRPRSDKADPRRLTHRPNQALRLLCTSAYITAPQIVPAANCILYHMKHTFALC